MDLEQAKKEIVAGLANGGPTENWDRWYSDLPADIRGRLSMHDFKRLGDCFCRAFEITIR